MLQKFIHYISEQHLIPSGATVLLAVSGGRDSIAMTHLMKAAGYTFAIAHCNFNLRPGDCLRDQQFVATMAKQMGVEFHTTNFDTHTFANANNLSIEDAARQLRYNYFASLCSENNYHSVATAHHSDDSVETFFLNLFRGTGISGLHGIRPISTMHISPTPLRVIHPMLCFSRTDINNYITSHHLAHVEDSTNSSLDMRRNRIRLQLMPLLRQLYPSVDTTMQQNIERLFETETIYHHYIEQLRTKLVTQRPAHVPTCPLTFDAIPIADLLNITPQHTLLFELLRPYGFNASTTDDILRALVNHRIGATFHSPSHRAATDSTHLLIAPITRPQPPQIDTTEVPPSTAKACPADTIFVDPRGLHFPLAIRPWRSADRIVPFGMQRSRLVSDLLKDLHINRIEKEWVYLLTDANDMPIWVVGLRADNRHRIEQNTTSALKITISNSTT